MSYDLAVFSPRAADSDELYGLIRQGHGLEVGEVMGDSITVVRGARRRYSFTVTGPDSVEAEDVPAEIAAKVLGAHFLYSIMVEGSSAEEIPRAVRFARRLAQSLDGAVIDQQMDEIWSRALSRQIRRPEREARVSTVDLRWCVLRDELPADAASRFLSTVGVLLPEALPRRFGEYEPFQGKFADSGADGFVEAWTAATALLFFSGTGPCVGGNLHAGPSDRFPGKFWSMSLTFLADPLKETLWSDALRRVFVGLADKLCAFYASAEVTEGHVWSGRSLWSDEQTEWSINPVRHRAGWMGLPPKPVWWSWLGRPFETYFGQMPNNRITPTRCGVLYESSSEPVNGQEPEPLSQWLPEDLFAKFAPNPSRQQPVPLIRAATIPYGLA